MSKLQRAHRLKLLKQEMYVDTDTVTTSSHQEYQEAREFNRLPLCQCDECVQRRKPNPNIHYELADLVRQQLTSGITPLGFNDGLFDMPEEPLPDIFFFLQSPAGLQPVVFWDYAFIGKQHVDYSYKQQDVPSEYQCEKDARRLRTQ
jgi:hypothetical protein